MSTGQPIPFFPHPPAQYNQGYFAQVTRAFAVYAEQMRASQLNNEFLTSSNNLSDLDDAATARTNLGLGTAAVAAVTTTPTDATAGRLLKVGDSATLLSASPAMRVAYGGTANAITLTTGAGISGTPPTGFGVRFRATAANTGATTIALDGGTAIACRTITGVALPSGYVRTGAETEAYFDGTFWVLDRQIERGSVSGGTFVRLADGTQICTQEVTIDYNSSTVSAEISWPAAFITQPAGGYSGIAGTSGAYHAAVASVSVTANATVFRYRVNTVSGTSANPGVFSGLGRWY